MDLQEHSLPNAISPLLCLDKLQYRIVNATLQWQWELSQGAECPFFIVRVVTPMPFWPLIRDRSLRHGYTRDYVHDSVLVHLNSSGLRPG